ncbi:MAG: MFS transporter, partial [Planctomycetes bacterium]|nr:MFS transporter [Planctomycetota bacterium]
MTDSPAPLHAAALPRTLKLPSAAWVLYDTANTVYAAVLTYLFAPYLGDLLESRSAQGVVNSASMVAAGLCVPVFASLADHTGRARLYLVISTLACIGGLACFGLQPGGWGAGMLALIAFFVANFGYNAALVFYNSLLPSVATEGQQGLVSGLGVGLGYIGTMIIVVLLDLPEKVGYPATFAIAAGIFFALALPCFLLVRERRVQSRAPFSFKLVRQQFSALAVTLRGLPRDRAVMWFLLGNFFCVDVLNTAILFFGDFTRSTFFVNTGADEWQTRSGQALKVLGMGIATPGELLKVAGLALNFLALLFGVSLGFLTDRWGSLRVLRLSAAFLALGLLGAALWAGGNLTAYLLSICVFGSLGLAGIWTAGRKLLIELA